MAWSARNSRGGGIVGSRAFAVLWSFASGAESERSRALISRSPPDTFQAMDLNQELYLGQQCPVCHKPLGPLHPSEPIEGGGRRHVHPCPEPGHPSGKHAFPYLRPFPQR